MLASLLALMLGGLLVSVMGGDESADDETEARAVEETGQEPDDVMPESQPELILGAPVTESGDETLGITVTETAERVDIAVDDATPGSILALTVADTTGTDAAGAPVEALSLRLYLLPEGEAFPLDPSGAAFDAPDGDTLAEWEGALGLTELADIALGTLTGAPGGAGDARDPAPEITANRAVESLFLESTGSVIGASFEDAPDETATEAVDFFAVAGPDPVAA